MLEPDQRIEDDAVLPVGEEEAGVAGGRKLDPEVQGETVGAAHQGPAEQVRNTGVGIRAGQASKGTPKRIVLSGIINRHGAARSCT